MNRAHSRIRPRGGGAPGGGAGFQPGGLFAAGERGLWLDPSDLLTMFQDSAGTTPVTGAGQVVGLIQDKSGNANHAFQDTEANKPILRNVLGLWWLEFDGVDDYLETKPLDFTNTNKVSGFYGTQKTLAAPVSVLVELSVSSALNNGSFAVFAPPANLPALTFGSRLRSSSVINTDSLPLFPVPTTAVLTTLMDNSAGFNTLRVNRSQTETIGTPTPANFGSYPAYIGRRAGTSSPFSGNLYGAIIRGVESGTADVLGAESYMGIKSGVSL